MCGSSRGENIGRQVHFRHTTSEQRTALFQEWERLGRKYGSVERACEKAHVSRQVHYTWKERFLEYGTEGLRFPQSCAPKNPHELASKIADSAAAVKRQHQTWGLRKVAAGVAQIRGISRPSHNTIKKALVLAGDWFRTTTKRKERDKRSIRS